MDDKNPLDLFGKISNNALSLSIQSLSLAKVLRKELAKFISENSSEKEEDILKRIDKSYSDQFMKEIERLSVSLEGLLEPALEKIKENKKS